MISIAGQAAVELVDPAHAWDGCDHDHAAALDLACYVTNGEPKETAAYVEWLRVRSGNMLGEPRGREWLDALVEALLASGTLSRAAILATIARVNEKVMAPDPADPTPTKA